MFDLVVGLMTYGRILGTSYEDYLAVRGMARIRHGYTQIAPGVVPYFTDTIHDDLTGVMVSYGSPPTKGMGAIIYQLTTSAGMTGVILALLGGVLGLSSPRPSDRLYRWRSAPPQWQRSGCLSSWAQ